MRRFFKKPWRSADYYIGADDYEYPLGLIQMCATSHAAQIKGEALPEWLEWLPNMPFDAMARHSMDFWLSSEDIPLPQNRIFYEGERVMLDVTETNKTAHQRLRAKLEQALNGTGAHQKLLERSLYLGKGYPAQRHGAPGRNAALRHGPGDLGAGPQLQSP